MSTGDKVVCIDDRFPIGVKALYTSLPTEGSVYVIRDIRIGIQPDCKTGDVSVLLVGMLNPPANSKSALERGFRQDRFRPLRELKPQSKQEKDYGHPLLNAVFNK